MSTSTTQTSSSASTSIPRRIDPDVEPDDAWKTKLRKRIEEGLQLMVSDAKASLDSRLMEQPVSAEERERLTAEYTQSMQTIRELATEQFQSELDRERQERRWATGRAVPADWSEAIKKEQQGILNVIKNDGAQAERSTSRTTELATAPEARPPPLSSPQVYNVPPLPASLPYQPPLSSSFQPSSQLKEERERRPVQIQSSRRVSESTSNSPREDHSNRRAVYGSLNERSTITEPWEGWHNEVSEESESVIRPPDLRKASIERLNPRDTPMNRSLERHTRSVSDRYMAHSPPKPAPVFWMPSISPEEDKAASKPGFNHHLARRGSTTSIKSQNSASSIRPPTTQPILERPNTTDIAASHEWEKERLQEAEQAWVPLDNGRERDKQGQVRTDSRPSTIYEQQNQYYEEHYRAPPSASTRPVDYQSSRPRADSSERYRATGPSSVGSVSSMRSPDNPLGPPPLPPVSTKPVIAKQQAFSNDGRDQHFEARQGSYLSSARPPDRYSAPSHPSQRSTYPPPATDPYEQRTDTFRDYSTRSYQFESPVHPPDHPIQYHRPPPDPRLSLPREPPYTRNDVGDRREASANDYHGLPYPHASADIPISGPKQVYTHDDSGRPMTRWSPAPPRLAHPPDPATGLWQTSLQAQSTRESRNRSDIPQTSRHGPRDEDDDEYESTDDDSTGDDFDEDLRGDIEAQESIREEAAALEAKQREQEAKREQEVKRKREESNRREAERKEEAKRKKAKRREDEAKRREEERERKEQENREREKEAEARMAEARRREEEEAREREREKVRIKEQEKAKREAQREAAAKKRREVAEEEADARRREEDAKRREEDARRREEDARRREEDERKVEEDAKRMEEDVRKMEEDARKMEEDVRRMEEDARKMEEETRRIEEEAETRRVEETRRKEEAKRQAEAEATKASESKKMQKKGGLKKKNEDMKRNEDFKRKAAEEDETKRNEEAKRKAVEEETRRNDELKNKEETRSQKVVNGAEERRKNAEARRKEQEEVQEIQKKEEIRKKDEEAAETLRQKEEEIRLREEEVKRREEELNRRDEEAKRKEEEAVRKEEEAIRKEEEAIRKEQEVKRKEEEVKRKEEGARRKEEEKAKSQQEEFRKREEEIRRRADERKRQDSVGAENTWKGPHSMPYSSMPSTASPRSPPPRSASTASASTEWSNGSTSSWGSSASSPWSTSTKASSTTSTSTPGPNRGSTSTPLPKPRAGSMGGGLPQSVPQTTPLSESEWARRQEEQVRKQQEQFRLEQERLENERQAKAGKIMSKEEVVQIYEKHERQWTQLPSFDELRWDTLPWPMLRKPTCPDDITMMAISAYILSPHYPEKDKNRPQKDRIKDHIRRWHPDRFETKLLTRVVEGEKERVKEGAGSVVRCLNDLLTRSNVPSMFS